MSKSKFNWENEKERIIDYINKGLSNIEIASIYGVKVDSFRKNLRKLGIRRRRENNLKLNLSKEELYKLLFIDNYRFKEISRIYNVTVNEVRRLCVEYDIYEEYISKVRKLKNNKDKSISTSTDLVPIDYSYPIINKMYLSNNYGNIQEFIYVPEYSKWISLNMLNSFLKKNNINIHLWKIRWINKFNGTREDEIEEIIKLVYNDKLPYTKEFIKSSLRNDINYECEFFCVKEDLINEYFISRTNDIFLIPYDFSNVPNIIKTRNSKFTISVPVSISGKIIGWETNYENLICEKQDYREYGNLKCLINKFFTYKDRFMSIISNNSEIIDYSMVEFKGMNIPIKLRCKKCNTIYYQAPKEHVKSLENLETHGCPKCRSVFFKTNLLYSFEDFVSKSKLINGDIFDFKNSNFVDLTTPISFRDKRTNEILHNKPRNILKGFCNNKNSFGEIFIEEWINSNNIEFYPHKLINNLHGRNSDYVIIDFIIIYNNFEFWIEYNGRQHYERNYFFHRSEKDFRDQLQRDQNVKDYCKENNITLIEIPYTYNTYEKVKELLDRVILGGEDINTIINYSSLYKNN